MKRKAILITALILLILIACVIVALVTFKSDAEKFYESIDLDKTLTVPDVDGEDKTFSYRDIKENLEEARRYLRKDKNTVVALVNGKEITAKQLNYYCIFNSIFKSGAKLAEKEMLELIIESLVIEDFVLEKGYVYEKTISEDLEDEYTKLIIYASGMSENEYIEMEGMMHKETMIYSKYLGFVSDVIVDDLAFDGVKIEDEELEKAYEEYKEVVSQIEPDDEDGLESVSSAFREFVDAFTKNLVDEADVVIYEDRLN